MDVSKLEDLRQKLIQKRLSLTEMMQRAQGYGREKEAETQDMADMAVESYTKEFMFGKSSGDRAVLQMIDDALARIERESYGECANCGNPIEPKRLEAIPWAGHCIECQERIEKGRL